MVSRFGSEAEQQHALSSMTGELGLGSKPIKVPSLTFLFAAFAHLEKLSLSGFG
jgi:hypothetical protein